MNPRILIELATGVAARYQISALSPLLAGVRASAEQDEISVAVLGRFKAGKSSFLNHLVGRSILPVGVVPVTAVVTELRYGVREGARVHQRDGSGFEIPLHRIGAYISEKENPENRKQAGLISVELPELRRFRGLRLVDTPGLESALSHNTRTSLDWLPRVELALLAVSVDPPLSQRDLDLLKSLYQYTPKVTILLTKADLLSQRELAEVVEYVRAQLARNFPEAPVVFPYSTRPGFESFRQALETELFTGTLQRFAKERESILSRKLDTLLLECSDYLGLGLKSAELLESDRRALKQRLIGEKEIACDVKRSIGLVVQQAAAEARSIVSHRLETHRPQLRSTLLAGLEQEFPSWSRSLATMLCSFEDWLSGALRRELTTLSIGERAWFLAPLQQVRNQVFRDLQQFRDRLNDRTQRAFGVPLRTAESEIEIVEPAAPDVRIGRVFDRNWELLSPVLPVWMIRAAVHRHFARVIERLIDQNLSRVSTQWEESIHGALRGLEKEAGRRLEELLGTVERLVDATGNEPASQLRADLERLEQARKSLAAGCPPA